MQHDPTSVRWGADPAFVQALRRWTWFREEAPTLMLRVAAPGPVDRVPVVDHEALARVFWGWAATLDGNGAYEPLDPVDHAHFEAGVLLAQLLRHRPLRMAEADRAAEVRTLTATAATVLGAWRLALGVAPPDPAGFPEPSDPRWAGCVENMVDDPSNAIAFLDLFTGREPVWRSPTIQTERPPLRRALERRRSP